MNKVMLMGNLVNDPESKTAKTGLDIATFRIAVNRIGKDKGADFINVKAFGPTAQHVVQYYKKGKPIIVEGRIAADSFDKEDGTRVFMTEVIAERVQFVLKDGTMREGAEQEAPAMAAAPKSKAPAAKKPVAKPADDDEAPF